MPRTRSRTAELGTAIVAAVLSFPWSAAPAREGERVAFNRDVRPILADRCFRCHGPDAGARKAGLRLDREESAEGERGGPSRGEALRARAIVPGRPQESEVVRRITSADPDERMPPPESGKELSAAEIALLTRWIEEGAEYEPHWSFVPPRRPPVPAVRDSAWPRGDIDRFILARIESAGLRPSPEADRLTLARRAYLDLTGLPPKPAEVDAFLADSRPDAFERLVVALLASPHFGERMAMYWLDLVRYADTVGYHGDQEHHASPYRDWVIRSFNENLPFDRFTVEQLAGDLLADATVDQKIASGYNRLLQTTHEGGAQDGEYLVKYQADRVRNLGAAWMAATVGCAQCHDHKYDPYTQRDFYSLAAFFADIEQLGAYKGPDVTPTPRPPEIEVISPLDRARADEIGRQIESLRAQVASSSAASGAEPSEVPEIAALEKSREELLETKRRAMITVSVAPRTVRILRRGDWMDTTGEVVEPAVPRFLEEVHPLGVAGRRATRLDLARWLTSPEHPQTARVFVNRLWYLFFGAGLSRTVDDGGAQGEWPTHPELLDWLAVELVESGWDVKRTVRLLVTSAAYRQSSLETEELRARDPENRLFARQVRFRLPAEMVRDSALAVSGLLVERLGGGKAHPYQPSGYYRHLNFPKREYKHDEDEGQYRRGLYVHWQRQYLHPMLKAFDAPSREECTAQRPVSTTPLQALVLLNDPSFVEAARVFAARIVDEGGTSAAERVRWAWRAVLSRNPAEREAAELVSFYERQLAAFRADLEGARQLTSVGLAPRRQVRDSAEPAAVAELAAWTSVARALFNLSETITRN